MDLHPVWSIRDHRFLQTPMSRDRVWRLCQPRAPEPGDD